MLQRHLSRKVEVIKGGVTHEYNLTIVSITRDISGKIDSYSLSKFTHEESAMLYHDTPLVIEHCETGEILFYEK